jgi:fructokinase
MSALMYCFHDKGMNSAGFKDYLQFANEMGAIATTEFGALTAISPELMNCKINSTFPE